MAAVVRTIRALCLLAAVVVGLLPHVPVAGQDRGPDRPPIDVEATYYRQPPLLKRALAQLQPSGAGQPRLYFVGFAGHVQGVFKREAFAVRELFDRQFSTKGRSLILVNHWSTVSEVPLASATNLDRALQHIGRIMNRDQDVLFLFLTSHGSKGVFAVDMTGFGLNNLTPKRLRGSLDRSGIRNRVIVVSACHSGSFIADLAEPNTLLITAAHADRTSFGCSDQNEWTYFGDAFFNRALRQERSFERAFHRASQLITRWEAKDRLTPSLPQIVVGEALRPKLAAIVGPDWEPPQE